MMWSIWAKRLGSAILVGAFCIGVSGAENGMIKIDLRTSFGEEFNKDFFEEFYLLDVPGKFEIGEKALSEKGADSVRLLVYVLTSPNDLFLDPSITEPQKLVDKLTLVAKDLNVVVAFMEFDGENGKRPSFFYFLGKSNAGKPEAICVARDFYDRVEIDQYGKFSIKPASSLNFDNCKD